MLVSSELPQDVKLELVKSIMAANNKFFMLNIFIIIRYVYVFCAKITKKNRHAKLFLANLVCEALFFVSLTHKIGYNPYFLSLL